MKSIVLFALVAVATVSAIKVKAPKTNTNGVRMTKAACGDVYDTGLKGNYQSPNYPEPYNPDDSCGWFLTAENDGRIAVVVHDLVTEASYDTFVVRDGISANSPILLELSGTASNIAVLSTVPKIFVGFFPDFSNQEKGFNFSWTADLPAKVELFDLL